MVLEQAAKTAPGGKVMLKTVEGEPITVWWSGGMWSVADNKGGMAKITIANVQQSNGVIMVIDKVLMP